MDGCWDGAFIAVSGYTIEFVEPVNLGCQILKHCKILNLLMMKFIFKKQPFILKKEIILKQLKHYKLP